MNRLLRILITSKICVNVIPNQQRLMFILICFDLFFFSRYQVHHVSPLARKTVDLAAPIFQHVANGNPTSSTMKRRSFAEPHSSLGLFAQHHASSNSPSSANGATGGAVQQWISVADGANKPRRSPGRTARRFSAFVGTNIGLAARRGSAMPVLQHEPEFEASTKSQQVLGLRNEEWNR